jgi:hypothetical protein
MTVEHWEADVEKQSCRFAQGSTILGALCVTQGMLVNSTMGKLLPVTAGGSVSYLKARETNINSSWCGLVKSMSCLGGGKVERCLLYVVDTDVHYG